MNDELITRLSAIVKAALPKEYTSVSYAITIDGKLRAAQAIGTQNLIKKEPATTECTYNVASVSKMFCTVAVMQLVEQGKVKLDTPVVNYLPRFKMPDERYINITLRHCLSHTSGLPGTQWRGFAVSSVYNAHYYDDVYDYLSKSTLKDEPGAYSVYCNDGFTLAEMVVAEISGESFHEYCAKHITEPIGAHSTRLAYNHNAKNPLVSEGKKPQEFPLICGGAGFTTTMIDLCKFGALFLEENKIISEKSKMEMAKMQGHTFLVNDEVARFYGLGWDNMNFHDRDYDIGEGVLIKGGNSFQFNSRFMIVPKYNAVVAISATHDCKLDVGTMATRLLATIMLIDGKNIHTNAVPVPQEIIDEYAGVYLMPSQICKIRIDGAQADITEEYLTGGSAPKFNGLKWNGSAFIDEKGQKILFESQGGDRFALINMRGANAGFMMHAKGFENEPKEWEARVGKSYIVSNCSPTDMVIYETATGFTVYKLPEYKGVYVLSFSGRNDSGVYGTFDASVYAVDENIGRGFLRTPGNPSRDLIDPIFSVKNDAEFCDVMSYGYTDVASLKPYEGQAEFPIGAENDVYAIKKELKKLPEIPENHRIMIMDEKMSTVYDSLFDDEYKPIKKGYISLI